MRLVPILASIALALVVTGGPASATTDAVSVPAPPIGGGDPPVERVENADESKTVASQASAVSRPAHAVRGPGEPAPPSPDRVAPGSVRPPVLAFPDACTRVGGLGPAVELPCVRVDQLREAIARATEPGEDVEGTVTSVLSGTSTVGEHPNPAPGQSPSRSTRGPAAGAGGLGGPAWWIPVLGVLTLLGFAALGAWIGRCWVRGPSGDRAVVFEPIRSWIGDVGCWRARR